MYVIDEARLWILQNIRTKQYMCGTNFCSRRQRLTDDIYRAMIFQQIWDDSGMMLMELKRRGISFKTYRLVEIELTVKEN